MSKQSERIADLRRRLFTPPHGTPDEVTPADHALLLELEQVATRLEQGEGFHVVSIVSHRTGRGMLDVSWMGQLAQIEPGTAREIGWALLEGAAVAETEAVLVRFLKEKVGLDADRAAAVLQDLRRAREQDPHGSLVGGATKH